jgi:signal transduction histidine kinase/CheY-like chemotaxis protein
MHPLRSWLPWAVLLSCLLFTLAGTTYVSHVAQKQDSERFTRAVQEVQAEVEQRIESSITLLRAGRALFAANEEISQAEFAQYVANMELRSRFPGVQGIGFSTRVAAAEVPRLERELRGEGLERFNVWPAEPRREEYHSIIYLEPLDARNRVALGYDMFSEPVRREAMVAARESGLPVASGKVTLVQEIDEPKRPGFLIFLPVYRGNPVPATVEERRSTLIGFIYLPFRSHELLRSVVKSLNQEHLIVRIFDGAEASPAALLFDSAGDRPNVAVSTTLVRTEALKVGGRQWTVSVAAGPWFAGASARLVPIIFGLGIGISVLLFLLTRAEAQAGAESERIARDLRQSEEALQVASRAKDEFLATLSHELRTPLNAILGWTRMLRLGHLEESRRVTALEVIERNARAQVQLIEDLLDVSRIITGKLRLDMKAIAVNPVIEEAVNTVRPSADAKGVRLISQSDPHVGAIFAAPDRLQQIIWNLLSNAIKFTPTGGLVELRAARVGNAVRLTVRDTGVGIQPAFLPHVFERFRQADSTTTRSHSGVGLGLAIVRHLVELHGGTISAASEGEGKGATFTVTFPVRESVAEAAADHPAVPAREVDFTGRSLDGLRVLVIDDELDARDLAAQALTQHGAWVDVASSVPDALEILDRSSVDVVVTDLAMPGEDGFALMQRLRQQGSPRFRFLPVIAVTAYARSEDRERVMSEGFQGFLAKPVEFDRLAMMVAQLAGRSGVTAKG